MAEPSGLEIVGTIGRSVCPGENDSEVSVMAVKSSGEGVVMEISVLTSSVCDVGDWVDASAIAG